MAVDQSLLGCILSQAYAEESDRRMDDSGIKVEFRVAQSQFVGRWERLKSSGCTGVFLWDQAAKFRPYKPHHQRRGTCFPAGTLVMMADGSEKPIESIVSGEHVIGHSGRSRQVLMTGSFNYSGRMATVRVARSSIPVVCTQEHEFLQCVNDVVPAGARVEYEGKRKRVYYRQGVNKWTSAQDLVKGDRLHVVSPVYDEIPLTVDLAKYCEDEVVDGRGKATVTPSTVRRKRTKHCLPRYLEFDSETAFIVGLYSAEGSTEKNRVTFTIDSRRSDLIERIQNWVADRLPGVNVELQEKRGGTAFNVRVGCAVFAEFIRDFVPGKAITKSPSVRILTTPKGIRKSFLNGWLAGDGCEHVRRNPMNTGVTSSVLMMRFFRRLSMSIGLNPSIGQRKQSGHQNAASFDITYAGSEFEKLNGRDCDRVSGEIHETSEFGWVTPVTEVSLSEVGDHVVYNLEVEEDHSYVVNGLAVANCVSRGFHRALEMSYLHSLGNSLALGQPVEIAYEPIYAGSRVYVGGGRINGDGSSGPWAGEWLAGIKNRGGFCKRGIYGSADLRQDNEKWACDNADRGDRMPAELLAECQKHTCAVHRCRQNSEIADAIASYFGIARCWDTLFGNRDKNGQAVASDTGAHCQAAIGVYVDQDDEDSFVEAQSWGNSNPSGPAQIVMKGGEKKTLPPGCYGVKFSQYKRAQQRSKWWDAYAISVRPGQEYRN